MTSSIIANSAPSVKPSPDRPYRVTCGGQCARNADLHRAALHHVATRPDILAQVAFDLKPS